MKDTLAVRRKNSETNLFTAFGRISQSAKVFHHIHLVIKEKQKTIATNNKSTVN